MRKIALVLTLLPLLALSALIDHLPSGYVAFFYIPDAGKLYSTFKKISLGKVLMDDLGLESLIVSTVEAYGVSQDALTQIKEIMFVTRGEKNGVLAFGPFDNPDDVVYALKELAGEDISITSVDGYVVLYSNDEILKDFSKGGGKYDDDPLYHRSGVVGFGQVKSEDAESFSVIYVTESSIEGESKVIPKGEMKQFEYYRTFSIGEIPNGDIVLVVNSGVFKEFLKWLEDVLDEDFDSENAPNHIFLTVGADVNEPLSQAIEQAMTGATQVSTEELPNLRGKVMTDEDLDETLKEECEDLGGGVFDCEGLEVRKIEGGYTLKAGEEPVGDVKEKLNGAVRGNEFLLFAWDMSGILEPIGLQLSSYVMGRGWVEKGILRMYFQLK